MSETAKTEIEELKQEFYFTLSKISHEIRNPVALIDGYLQLISKKYPQITEFDYWSDICENMDYLSRLLKELSNYNNSSQIRKEPVNMPEFMEKTIASFRPILDYLEITLVYQADPTITTLSIDPVKLREVILNLVNNALEAVSNKGQITLDLAQEEDWVCLSVEDNGEGIPAEYLPDLFEPFVTHREGGTGLGLAIAKKVAVEHGGDISVTSCPGKGTTFQIRLPLN